MFWYKTRQKQNLILNIVKLCAWSDRDKIRRLQNMMHNQFLYCSNPKDPSQSLGCCNTDSTGKHQKEHLGPSSIYLQDMAVIKEMWSDWLSQRSWQWQVLLKANCSSLISIRSSSLHAKLASGYFILDLYLALHRPDHGRWICLACHYRASVDGFLKTLFLCCLLKFIHIKLVLWS